MNGKAIRFNYFIFAFVTLSLLYSSTRAMAQDPQVMAVNPDYRVSVHQSSRLFDIDLEITPIIGYTFGGSFEEVYDDIDLEIDESESYGIIIGITNDYDAQFEFLFSHQPTVLKIDEGPFAGDPLFDLDIQYFHIGGTYAPNRDNLNFYVSGGFGLTHMNPDIGNSETKFSLSLGAGIKFFLTDHIGLRFEGRGFGTYYNGSSAIFCDNGNCTIHVTGDMLWQFTVFSGLIVRF